MSGVGDRTHVAPEPAILRSTPGEQPSSGLPRVVAVVLNWRLPQATVRCVRSLEEAGHPGLEVVVVDNGSDDGSEERIRAERPGVPVLQAGRNLGYAGGNNLGIREALARGADFVWILNNDTVVDRTALPRMLRAAADSDVGIVGSAVLNSLPHDEASRISAAAFTWHGARRLDFRCPRRPGTCPDDGHRVDAVAGTSILLRAAMLRTVGRFDERFFHYWDDMELCARATRAGWAVRYACLGAVWHAVSATIPYASPQARYYFVRNWLLFSAWTRGDGPLALLRRDPALAMGRVSGAPWLVRGRWRMAAASLLGAIDGVRGRTGPRSVSW